MDDFYKILPIDVKLKKSIAHMSGSVNSQKAVDKMAQEKLKRSRQQIRTDSISTMEIS